MHEWGYAPTLSGLAEGLLRGRARIGELREALRESDRVLVAGDFVYLRGYGDLLEKSRARRDSHALLNGQAVALAADFTRDLVRVCPFVDCVALSGSVASGGYAHGDDIDFDLFVQSGTKYTCYLLAILVGLRYSWRYRDLGSAPSHRTPILPKVTCVNVVWPEDQSSPFARQDAALAFELFRCSPLYGSRRFRAVLEANPWLERFFPQVYERGWTDALDARPGPLSMFLGRVAGHRTALRLLEAASRRIAWLIYSFVQVSRKNDPEALERMAFLRRVKYPYEVFQD